MTNENKSRPSQTSRARQLEFSNKMYLFLIFVALGGMTLFFVFTLVENNRANNLQSENSQLKEQLSYPSVSNNSISSFLYYSVNEECNQVHIIEDLVTGRHYDIIQICEVLK